MKTCKYDNNKHYANGLCQVCYMRDYRLKYPEKTDKGLRAAVADAKAQLDTALDVGRSEVTECINEFLHTIEGVEASCRYSGGELRIRIGENKGSWKL